MLHHAVSQTALATEDTALTQHAPRQRALDRRRRLPARDRPIVLVFAWRSAHACDTAFL